MYARPMYHKIDPLFTYGEAVAKFNEVKPIRGSDVRPIGKRRDKHMQILMDEQSKEVRCRLYNTDVITFRPNGEVVLRFNGWSSSATIEFISAILRIHVRKFDNLIWLRELKNGEIEEYPLDSHGENVLTPMLKLKNIENHRYYTYRKSREKANNVRSRYATFTTYLEGVLKLRADPDGRFDVKEEELIECFGWRRLFATTVPAMPLPVTIRLAQRPNEDSLDEFMRLVKSDGANQAVDFYKATLWLFHSLDGVGKTRHVVSDLVRKVFDDVLMYVHRDEVFIKFDVTGKAVKNDYAKFFGQ